MAAQLKTVSPAAVLQAVGQLSSWTERADSQTSSQQEICHVFSSLSSYIRHLVATKQLQNESMREAIHSLVTLAIEASSRLEKVHGQGSVTTLTEFKEFYSLYQHKVLPLFPKKPQLNPSFAEKKGTSSEMISGLEQIKSDKDYELFFIKKEGGASYVSPFVKTHIDLLLGLNVLFLQEESFIQKVECAQDRESFEIARAILKENAGLIDAFWKEALKFKANPFVLLINKALMALLLASNSRNLRINTSLKSSSLYYRDFHRYLREAFSPRYTKKMSSEEMGVFIHTAWQLSLQLLSSLFLANAPKQEMTHLLTTLFSWKEGDSYSALSNQDQRVRSNLSAMPSLPLLLAAKALQEEMVGFDPLLMGAPLEQRFRIALGNLDISVLYLPSPTYQENINSSDCVQEFTAWIDSMKREGHHHLMINLQDRASWKEYARASTLEKKQIDGALTTLSFDRNTLFYEQSGVYENCCDSESFFEQCKDQILSPSTGFYFPESVDRSAVEHFLKESLVLTHRLFFRNANTLNQEERQDFIEIFQILLSLKMMELLKVDTVSFTDKDGFDSSACMNAELFAFCHMLSNKESLSEEECRKFLTLCYAPALGTRGRLMEEVVFHRMIRMLTRMSSIFASDHTKVVQELSSLYSTLPRIAV